MLECLCSEEGKAQGAALAWAAVRNMKMIEIFVIEIFEPADAILQLHKGTTARHLPG